MLRVAMTALILAASMGLGLVWPANAEPPPTVTVETGSLSGSSADGVQSFKGIPYASPPLGPLRWRAPQPPVAWSGLRGAAAFGDICMQWRPAQAPTKLALPMSENCLTLNVFRPASARKDLPVMVWIHGGALLVGSSADPAMDGSAFARRGVILVSVNYRLGRFGFFAHPALSAEHNDGGRLGNYGLMDQIAALKWVKRNIKAFGGDPNRVTIFGESAGAASVEALMISPLSRDLFQGAIAESAYGYQYPHVKESADGGPSTESAGIEFAKDLGLSNPSAGDLRALSAAAINGVGKFDQRGGLAIDGVVLKEDLLDAFQKGEEAHAALIVGSNSVEYSAETLKYANRIPPPLSPALKARALQTYADQTQMDERLVGDTTFAEQARRLAALHAKAGHTAYLYRFSTVPAGAPATLKGAPHGSEVVYVFDTLSANKWRTDAADEQVAKSMNAYWSAFAVDGKPDLPGAPVWLPVQSGQVMDFTRQGPMAQQDPLKARLDVLQEGLDDAR